MLAHAAITRALHRASPTLRHLLLAATSLASLAGCQGLPLPENAPDPRDLVRHLAGDGSERPWSSRERTEAARARELFAAARSAQPAPGAAATRAQAVLRRYRGHTRLSVAAQDSIIDAFTPLLDARAAVRPVRPSVGAGGRELTLPPHGLVRLQLRTYCMDLGVAAPDAGEKHRLVPITGLLDRELVPIHQGLMAWSHTHPAQADQVQRIVWNLRDFDTGRLAALSLRPEDFALLDRAHPGAGAVLRGYEQRTRVRRWAVGTARAQLDELLQRRGIDLSRPMASLASADRQVTRLLDAMATLPIATALPSDDSDYSMLQPGVAAFAEHPVDGPRGSTLTLLNTNAHPVVFRPGDHALQSRRVTQRLAVGGVEPVAAPRRALPNDPPIEPAYLLESLIPFMFGGRALAAGVGQGGRWVAQATAPRWAAFTERMAVWSAQRHNLARPDVSNRALRNVVDQLYRPTDRYPGGTAGAIRVERLTGNAGRDHPGKAAERIRNLQRVMREQELDASDSAAAQRMIDDLTNALNGR